MTRSNSLSTILLVAGLSVLATAALAQSAGAGSKIGSDTPERVPPVTQPTPPASIDPSVTPNAPDPAQAGSNTSGYGSAVQTDARANLQTESQNNLGFDQLDTDRDGRLSLSEYSQSLLLNTRRSATQRSAAAPGGATPATDPDSGDTTGGRSGATTGVAGGSQAAHNPAELFRQLDTNSDGYLSRSELEAAGTNGSGVVGP